MNDGAGATIPRHWRWAHRLYAHVAGYFWLPCPLCGEHFGGHEWQFDLCASIPGPRPGVRTGVCPTCTATRRAENADRCTEAAGLE